MHEPAVLVHDNHNYNNHLVQSLVNSHQQQQQYQESAAPRMQVMASNPLEAPILETGLTSQALPIAEDQHQQLTDLIFSWAPGDFSSLLHAFLASFSVIIVSELGDKTFIITAIMAMKNSRLLVLISSSMALLMMTLLSVGMGVAVTIVPKLYTHYASIVLFFGFGLKMLHEAFYFKEGSEAAEFEETLEEQEKSSRSQDQKKAHLKDDTQDDSRAKVQTVNKQTEVPQTNTSPFSQWLRIALKPAPLMINVFTMIFVAEWGDRSQISTVILAARENATGVFLGSLLGHTLCTALAVMCGRIVADVISVKTSKYYQTPMSDIYRSKAPQI